MCICHVLFIHSINGHMCVSSSSENIHNIHIIVNNAATNIAVWISVQVSTFHFFWVDRYPDEGISGFFFKFRKLFLLVFFWLLHIQWTRDSWADGNHLIQASHFTEGTLRTTAVDALSKVPWPDGGRAGGFLQVSDAFHMWKGTGLICVASEVCTLICGWKLSIDELKFNTRRVFPEELLSGRGAHCWPERSWVQGRPEDVSSSPIFIPYLCCTPFM